MLPVLPVTAMNPLRRLSMAVSDFSVVSVPERRRRQDTEKLNDQGNDSSESDSEIDETIWHSRTLDPEEADVYLDALWGPLFFRYERIRRDKDCAARLSDYRLVSLFLLVNLTLQLSIAWKIAEVSTASYGEIGDSLFNGACWRISPGNRFLDLLYPPEFQTSDDFDCLQPILTLSMFPEKLDLDQNGFWSQDEAESLTDLMVARGSQMADAIPQVLHRMAKYDFANRIGSQSRSEDDDDVNLDMKFFEHYRGKIQMCLPIDPNVCGNLERRGNLKTILPEIKHSQERVAQCQDNFDNFCVKLFGGDYTWIHSVTSDICGQASFSRAKGINTVQYAAVATYKGQADSVIGTTFVSFLVLLLFIWGMLLIAEIRATYNFLYVVWYTASTENTDPNFACFKDKLVVKQLPRSHKIFAVLCIGLPRLLIAIVLLIVGAKFLSATDNLQDLVLNATALCFLIEVDNMIHAAFLGESFEKRVTHQCDVLQVPASAQGTSQSYITFAFVVLTTIAWTAWVYYSPQGLRAIGEGMDCLCEFEGNYCFGAHLITGLA